MDTVSIPRGGRVVFRSRFADYTGMWVNHCHILMHEDHGMMQAVAVVPRAAGLGLAISRSIVTDNGGSIRAENNRDGGATFHCALPAIAAV